MEDEEDLAPEAGEVLQESEVEALKKSLAKANKEAARYRIEARNSKIESEFGEKVAKFVPKDLSLDEARQYAQDLKETFGSSETEAQEPEAGEEAPEASHPLAAVSHPSTQGKPTEGRLSAQDVAELALTDPTAAALAWRRQSGRG